MPLSSIRDRLEEAHHTNIGCSGGGCGHEKGMSAAVEPDQRNPAQEPLTYFESAVGKAQLNDSHRREKLARCRKVGQRITGKRQGYFTGVGYNRV